jgi:hypothetical protein
MKYSILGYATKMLNLPLYIDNIVRTYPIYLKLAAEQSYFPRLFGSRIIVMKVAYYIWEEKAVKKKEETGLMKMMLIDLTRKR